MCTAVLGKLAAPGFERDENGLVSVLFPSQGHTFPSVHPISDSRSEGLPPSSLGDSVTSRQLSLPIKTSFLGLGRDRPLRKDS